MKTLKLAFAIASVVAATSAHALWDPYMMELNYVVNLNSDGRVVSFPAENYHANGPIRRTSELLQAMPTRLLSSLDELVLKAINERTPSNVTISNFAGHIEVMTIKAGLQARPDGGVDASIGLPDYTVRFNASGSQYGVSYNCRAVVKFLEPTLRASFGAVAQNPEGKLPFTSKPPSHSANCSTSVDWIPILGQLANNFATDLASGFLASAVAKASKFAEDIENTVDLQGPNFGETLLQLVGPNSELGQYIYNNRGRVASSTSVEMTLSRGIIVGPESFPPTPSLVSFDGRFFELKLNVPGRRFAVEVYERGTLRTPPVHCYKNSNGQLICIEI